MNHIHTIIVIIITLTFTACDSTPPAKVVKSKPFVRETAAPARIAVIENSGVVYLGNHPGMHAGAICMLRNHVLLLEGKASVGDSAVLVYNYEDQELDNGKVQRVLKSIRVRSNNNKAYEAHFETTDGDNHPGTKAKIQD
jgi:hypothetical protein